MNSDTTLTQVRKFSKKLNYEGFYFPQNGKSNIESEQKKAEIIKKHEINNSEIIYLIFDKSQQPSIVFTEKYISYELHVVQKNSSDSKISKNVKRISWSDIKFVENSDELIKIKLKDSEDINEIRFSLKNEEADKNLNPEFLKDLTSLIKNIASKYGIFIKSRVGFYSLIVTSLLFCLILIINFRLDTITFNFLKTEYNLKQLLLAICEAGMIGGIADWYAVTCLFKHPFGITTKHSKLLPQKQSEIANGIKGVINDFIPENIVKEEIEKIKFSKEILVILKNEKYFNLFCDSITNFLKDTVDRLIEQKYALDSADKLLEYIKTRDLAFDISKILQYAANNGIFEILMPSISELLQMIIAENKRVIEDEIDNRLKKKIGWLARQFVGQKGPEVLYEIVKELKKIEDPKSEAIKQIKSHIFLYTSELMDNEKKRESVNKDLISFLDNIRSRINNLSSNIINEIFETLRNKTGNVDFIYNAVKSILENLSTKLSDDDYMQSIIDKKIGNNIIKYIYDYNLIDKIAKIVSSEINKLSSDKFSQFIERKLYNELQSIRLNGVLTGGLIGIVLYIIKTLIEN
ncbi:MAG: DUF445 family protein [Bacteroidales bacterium]